MVVGNSRSKIRKKEEILTMGSGGHLFHMVDNKHRIADRIDGR